MVLAMTAEGVQETVHGSEDEGMAIDLADVRVPERAGRETADGLGGIFRDTQRSRQAVPGAQGEDAEGLFGAGQQLGRGADGPVPAGHHHGLGAIADRAADLIREVAGLGGMHLRFHAGLLEKPGDPARGVGALHAQEPP